MKQSEEKREEKRSGEEKREQNKVKEIIIMSRSYLHETMEDG